MADIGVDLLLLEPAPQFLRQDDRTMVTSRAADPDGEIGLALLLVAGNQETEEVFDLGEELPGVRRIRERTP